MFYLNSILVRVSMYKFGKGNGSVCMSLEVMKFMNMLKSKLTLNYICIRKIKDLVKSIVC